MADIFSKIKLGREALFFLLLLTFFIIFGLPYEEIKMWGISKAGKSAGFDISVTDSSFIFPLGIELRGARINSLNRESVLKSSYFDELSLRLELMPLLSGRKQLAFHLKKEGEGYGTATLSGERIDIKIDAEKLALDGLTFQKGMKIISGQLNLKGEFSIYKDHTKGDSDLTLSLEDTHLTGISPILSEVHLNKVSIKAEKRDSSLVLEYARAIFEGINISGKGEMTLKNDIRESPFRISAVADIEDSKKGALSGMASLAIGLAQDPGNIRLEGSGTLSRPALTVDGQKIL